MTVSPDIRKRLLYAKYLISRGRDAQNEQHDLSLAVSLLLMHDAAEMMMLAVVDHLQASLPKKWDFMDLWTAIKKGNEDPPQRNTMESMNKMRVALKHNGVLPHEQTVRDLLPKLEAFCEDVSAKYLDINFTELSLADLVVRDDVRTALIEARNLLHTDNRAEAFVRLKVAFDLLNRPLEREVPLIPELSQLSTHFPKDVRRLIEPYEKSLQQVIKSVNLLTLGVDPIRYRHFARTVPAISWTLSDNYQALVWKNYGDVSDEVFEECFNFVVDASMRLSAVFRM